MLFRSYRLNRALVALAAGDTAAALKGAAGHEQATDPSWAAVAASVRLAAGSTITGARSWDAAERAVRHAIEVRGVVDRDLADCLVRAAADSDADRAARAADLALGQLLLRGSDDELQAIRRRLRLLGGAGAAIPLGPWSLRRPLASGGAGQVWEATHRDRGTAVAVKLLPPEVLASPALRATLTTEIRAVAALNHPNVIAVLDQGQIGRAHV